MSYSSSPLLSHCLSITNRLYSLGQGLRALIFKVLGRLLVRRQSTMVPTSACSSSTSSTAQTSTTTKKSTKECTISKNCWLYAFAQEIKDSAFFAAWPDSLFPFVLQGSNTSASINRNRRNRTLINTHGQSNSAVTLGSSNTMSSYLQSTPRPTQSGLFTLQHQQLLQQTTPPIARSGFTSAGSSTTPHRPLSSQSYLLPLASTATTEIQNRSQHTITPS